MFRRCDYKLQNMQIYVMTSNASLFGRGSKEEKDVLNRAQNLSETDIQVVLLQFTDDFYIEPFYHEFLVICDNTEPENVQWTTLLLWRIASTRATLSAPLPT